jgi:glycosyltransferase involved in cell wall biosynthesis
MKILRIVSTLDPEYGGPVAAAVSQSAEMLRQGHQVDFVTLDAERSSFLTDVPGVVHALGPSRGKYGLNFRLVDWLKDNAWHYDLILVHGVWQFHSLATWLASRQAKFDYYIYTHGMLDPWFKTAYPMKHIKKWVYWVLIERRVLRDARGVLFTCEEERILAPKSFPRYKANEIVVAYGIQAPADDPLSSRETFFREYPQLREKRLLLFLSRIHPKKGCDQLIEAFAQVKDADPRLHLVLAGPDQVGWTAELQKLAEKLGVAERITWMGMASGDRKWGAYRAADVFVLPSHSENFGVVIAEALACGLPVLTTNKVNIWREVEEDGAGFIANDDLPGITGLLTKWISMSDRVRDQMRVGALASFTRRYEISQVVKNLFAKLQQE